MSYPLLPYSTQLTSRAALSEGDELMNILPSRLNQEFDLEVQRLHDIVRRSLGNFDVCLKRRKLNNTPKEINLEATDMPFRLISRSLPPRLVHLVTAHHSSVCNQRPAEDTVDEAQLRQMRAQEAAVDADCILAYAHTFSPRAVSSNEIFTHMMTGTNPANPSQLPSLLVTKRHRPSILSASRADGNKAEHGHVKCCSLVPLTDQSLSEEPKRKRKRRRYPVRDRPPPAFFQPMQEWGGKSAGYAMGWRDTVHNTNRRWHCSTVGRKLHNRA